MSKLKLKNIRGYLIFVTLTLVALGLLWRSGRFSNIKDIFSKQVGEKFEQITEQEIVDQVNSYRTANKMMALTRNEKLDRAALARLLVIKSDRDYSGARTGLSLENAVKNNDYNFSSIGEIDAENIGAGTKLVEQWSGNEEQKKILGDKNYREVGVAIGRDGLTTWVVLVAARQMVIKVEKLGAGGYPVVSWGGPELWEAINKRRVELGVGQLSKKDELCTIASIRLNQLLELGKLDGHAGFEPLLNRPDIAPIRQKYNLAEYLIVGYPTPQETVAGWEHTLGHRGLLAGGEYVWGCVYSQNTFAVAIAAY